MTTKFIGIKEFRQNISKLGKKKNMRFIVMNHSEPFLKVETINEDELFMQMYAKDIEEALKQVDKGQTRPLEEVMKELGIALKK